MVFVERKPAPLPAFLREVWAAAGCDIAAAEESFAKGFRPAFRAAGKADSAALEKAFVAAGIAVSPSGLPGGSWHTDRAGQRALREGPWVEEGSVYLQNPSSQLPPHVAGLFGTPARVLDMCAAPGGKTTLLSRLFPDAEIVALERDKIRYERLIFNVGRQGCANVRCFVADALSPSKMMLSNPFDAVLVDAPCTGTGTLTAFSGDAIDRMSADYAGYARSRSDLQKRLLAAAFRYVKKGGLVVYSTGSADVRENEEVAATAVGGPVAIPESLRSIFRHGRPGVNMPHALRIDPSSDAEGFFCAVFRA